MVDVQGHATSYGRRRLVRGVSPVKSKEVVDDSRVDALAQQVQQLVQLQQAQSLQQQQWQQVLAQNRW